MGIFSGSDLQKKKKTEQHSLSLLSVFMCLYVCLCVAGEPWDSTGASEQGEETELRMLQNRERRSIQDLKSREVAQRIGSKKLWREARKR